MEPHVAATPFGRRSMTLALIATQAAARDFAAHTNSSNIAIHKWRLFQALTEAKTHFNVTDRDLSVLYALLSFHPETALTLPTGAGRPGESDRGDAGAVVFPSNNALSMRAHGMAPTTLRRHLAALVASGLIIRRDSPNGKRYARKGQGGEIEYAFGFDLTPLIARAAEIENVADEVRAEKKAVALLRERVTLLRRDIAKMIEVALEEGVPGDWEDRHLQYQQLSSRYRRNLLRAELADLAQALSGLLTEIQITLENHIKQEKMAGNDRQIGRHIQNQTTHNSDIEPCIREGGAEPLRPNDQNPEAATAFDVKSPRAPKPYPLGMVLEACPDILDFARGGIASWGDFTSTAALVRPALGISPDAWRQAAEAMGEIDAAIVVAAILQRGDEIKSAGGYLRVLTGKAGAGEFSIGPVLMALIRGRKGNIDRRRA